MKIIKKIFLASLLCSLLTARAMVDSGGVDVGNGEIVESSKILDVPGTRLQIKIPDEWRSKYTHGRIVIKSEKGGWVKAKVEQVSRIGDIMTIESLLKHAQSKHPSSIFRQVSRGDIVGVESEKRNRFGSKTKIVAYLMGLDKRPIELTAKLGPKELEEGKKIIASVRMRYQGIPTANYSLDVSLDMIRGARPGLCLSQVALNPELIQLNGDQCPGPLLHLENSENNVEMLTVVRQSPEIGMVLRISDNPVDYDKISVNETFLQIGEELRFILLRNIYDFRGLGIYRPIGIETISGDGTYLVRAAVWPTFDVLFRVRIQNNKLTIGPLAEIQL